MIQNANLPDNFPTIPNPIALDIYNKMRKFKNQLALGDVDIDVINDVINNTFVAGGAIASLTLHEKVNDYDLYCVDVNTLLKLQQLVVDSYDIAILCETPNAITLDNDIQINKKHSGSPNDIIATFDFEHCCGVFDNSTNQLNINAVTASRIKDKILQYRKTPYPVNTLLRLRKFIAIGWTIDTINITNIAKAINGLDLTEDELQSQLVGISSSSAT